MTNSRGPRAAPRLARGTLDRLRRNPPVLVGAEFKIVEGLDGSRLDPQVTFLTVVAEDGNMGSILVDPSGEYEVVPWDERPLPPVLGDVEARELLRAIQHLISSK